MGHRLDDNTNYCLDCGLYWLCLKSSKCSRLDNPNILTVEQIRDIDRKQRGIAQAHEMARITNSHEILRAFVAELEGGK